MLMLYFLLGCILLDNGEISISDSLTETSQSQNCVDDPNCHDADMDGYVQAEDCDDNNALLVGFEDDFDCDGISNEIDTCPEDPWNDLDDDGLCGEQDPICNMDIVITEYETEKKLEQLNSCETVVGNIIFRQTTLENIPIFENLIEVDGSLVIIENEFLDTVDSFPNLETISEDLQLIQNSNLNVLAGFSVLQDVRRLAIIDNHSLCMSTINHFIEDLGYPNTEIAGNNSEC